GGGRQRDGKGGAVGAVERKNPAGDHPRRIDRRLRHRIGTDGERGVRKGREVGVATAIRNTAGGREEARASRATLGHLDDFVAEQRAEEARDLGIGKVAPDPKAESYQAANHYVWKAQVHGGAP